MGVQLVSVCQDITQLQARFGRRAGTIVNNHRAKLAGRGISDIETLNYFTHLIGSGEFEQRSFSTSSDRHSRHSQTQGNTYRELAPALVLREIKSGSVLIVYGSLPPTTVNLRPWHRNGH